MKLKIIILIILFCQPIILFSEITELLKQKWRYKQYSTDDGLPTNNILDIIFTPAGKTWAYTAKGFCYFNEYYWIKATPDSMDNIQWANIRADNYDGLYCVDLKYNLYKTTRNNINLINLFFNNKKLRIIDVIPSNNNSIITLSYIGNDTIPRLFRHFSKSTILIDSVIISKNIPAFPEKLLIYGNDKNQFFYYGFELYKIVDNKLIKVNDNLRRYGDFHTSFFNYTNNKVYGYSVRPKRTEGLWAINLSGNEIKQVLSIKEQFLFRHAINSRSIILCIMNDESCIEIDTLLNQKEFIITDEYGAILDIKFDKFDNLWMITDRGIVFVNLNSKLWNKNSETQKNFNSINSIVKDSDSSILCAAGNGFLRIRNKKIEYQISHIEELELQALTGIAKDKQNHLWITSGSSFTGAFKFSDNRWSKVGAKDGLAEQCYHKICKDKFGNLIFLPIGEEVHEQNKGVFSYNDTNIKIIFPELINLRRVYDYVETKYKYFASSNGILIFSDKLLKHITLNDGLKTKDVFSLAVDSSGTVWFAARNYGLGYIDSNFNIHYPEIFSENEVSLIWDFEFDPYGRMWIGTRQGIYLYSNGVITQFDKSSGLSHTLIWPVLFDNDKLYIGTLGGGLNVLDLKMLDENKLQVVLKALTVSKDNLLIDLNIYSHYLNPLHTKKFVRFKIDNGNFSEWSKWIPNKPFIFNNLDEGKHKIFIEVFDGIEKSSISSSVFDFNVEMPFFESYLFKIITGIIVLSMIITSLLYYRVNVISKSKAMVDEINKKLSFANKELANQKEIITNKNYQLMDVIALRNRLLSIISHEVRNPLAALKLSHENLLTKISSENIPLIRERVERNSSNISSVVEMLGNVISWAKSQENFWNFNPVDLNLNELIENVKNNYSIHYEEKKIKVNLELIGSTEIYADKQMLESIISNLLSNAIKFSKPYNMINIKTWSDEHWYFILIEDFGVGMTEETIDKLFKVNINSNDGTSKERGTGFGLILIKEFIDMHKGLIFFESKLEVGTKVTVKLPQKIEESFLFDDI